MKKNDRPSKQVERAISLPGAAADALSYFTREEAKITSSSVMKGGLALAALGMMSFPEIVKSAHESLHVSWNNHANRAAEAYHINVAAINQHVNANTHSSRAATAAHSNVNTHASTAVVDAHNSANVHASTAAVNTHASKPAINVAAVHASSALTKGSLHNNSAQGKHTAWNAHASQATSAHASTAASTTHNSVAATGIHSNVNTHASAGALNTHRNHNNSVSSPAVNRHAHITSHSSAVATNVHASIVAVNMHSNANTHGAHNSHSSW